MDFEKVLEILTKEFTNAKIRYALIGGFALGAWGILRSTMDLDFLADSRDLEKIEKILNQYDYKCIYKTENVSQYVSDIKLFGAIDFLHAFRKISLAMIKRSKDLPVFDGKLNIRVVIPEDIIGLKLQALVNDATRKNREYADIEAILAYSTEPLDWNLLQEYFSLFEQQEKYEELKEKYGSFK